MFSDRSLLFPSPPMVLATGDVARFPNQPKVIGSNNEGSQMSDENCPNESPSVDDATEYSKEQEEANSISCEEVL